MRICFYIYYSLNSPGIIYTKFLYTGVCNRIELLVFNGKVGEKYLYSDSPTRSLDLSIVDGVTRVYTSCTNGSRVTRLINNKYYKSILIT
jgi:hypothetical protein